MIEWIVLFGAICWFPWGGGYHYTGATIDAAAILKRVLAPSAQLDQLSRCIFVASEERIAGNGGIAAVCLSDRNAVRFGHPGT